MGLSKSKEALADLKTSLVFSQGSLNHTLPKNDVQNAAFAARNELSETNREKYIIALFASLLFLQQPQYPGYRGHIS